MGERKAGQGPVDRAIGSSVRGNSTAFGFSIMITLSFGMLSHLRGSPDVREMLLFGVAAAVAVSVLEAAASRGFRLEIEQVSQRTDMLGTALNFISVAAAVGTVAAIGELVTGTLAWPLGAIAASTVYVLIESFELFVAEVIQGEEGEGEGKRERSS